MIAPPPHTATTAPDLGANHEGQHLSVATLAQQARKVLMDRDEHMSGSRIRKLIRQYLNTGRGDIDFRTWFIAYADPTGETAVRNVMQGGGNGAA